MTVWHEVALTDLGHFSSGKPIVPGQEGPFKAYGSNGVIGGSTEARHDRGVVVGRVGAYCGSVAVSHDPFWASDNTIVIEPRVDEDLDYLYYLLRSANLNRHAGGSAQPLVTQGTLKSLSFRVPERALRIRIGQVLADFDRLIENNRRRIEVLEEMARGIYREWFVKFRYPGHGDVPMVDSVVGPIPEGWAVGKIGELCSRVQAGSTPRRSTTEYWDNPVVDWYKTGDLTDGVLLGSSEKLSNAGLEVGRTFEPETILMAIYGATVGRLGLLTSTASANQAALGLVANSDVCSTEYLWFTLESLRGHLIQIAQGAAQQNVSKQKVLACETLVPASEVVHMFTDRVAPIWRLSHELAREAAVLESLGDLLLPKLVTGQIDVSMLGLEALLVEQVA